ncbi:MULTISPECIES: DUF6460 domain-containing protein [Rhodoplanes]
MRDPERRPSIDYGDGMQQRSSGSLERFLGGSPGAVAVRLVLLSVLVGVIMSAIGLDPWNIIQSVERLLRSIWDMGFDAVVWLWRYFLLGAVLVIPIWLVLRLAKGGR